MTVPFFSGLKVKYTSSEKGTFVPLCEDQKKARRITGLLFFFAISSESGGEEGKKASEASTEGTIRQGITKLGQTNGEDKRCWHHGTNICLKALCFALN